MGPLCLLALWVGGAGVGQAPRPPLKFHVAPAGHRLCGQLLDFTCNHGFDRRIWSPALGRCRDLYVYLPPGFDPARKYPLAIFLHGAAQDENFFRQELVGPFDRAIAQGLLPPVIIAAPDGSVHGRATLLQPTTFWANSRAGRFEDYVMTDVWNFLMTSFPIQPEREAHALIGASAGGSGAFGLAIKHKDRVKIAIGFMPALNHRYVDGQGRYQSDFRPDNFAFRGHVRLLEPMGRIGLVAVRFNTLYGPLFGRGPDMIAGMSEISPLEVMERHDLKKGELDLYAAYGGCDELNITAQVDSFVYVARQRGIEVTTDFDPCGRHDLASAMRQFPAALRWASARLPAKR